MTPRLQPEILCKYLKAHNFVYYAQTHGSIWFVLMGLSCPYAETHAPYDQTHGSYGQAHALALVEFGAKLLNLKCLLVLLDRVECPIWNGLWFG